LLSHYRHSFAWLLTFFFFATSFQIQAAQPTASDKESGSEKIPYRSCTEKSFGGEEFPTLALLVADRLKYSREQIYRATCKAWPGNPSRSLVALVRSRQVYYEFDLDVLVVKSQSGDILQHLQQKIEIPGDAGGLDSITFDTANYQLAPGVRAFGARTSHSRNGGTSSYLESLSLYVPHKNKLKPVLLNLTMSRSVWNQGVCVDTFSTQRTLEIGKTSHHGYADLVLSAKNTEPEPEAKMIDGNCPEKQWSKDYSLIYDGVKYVVPKGFY
jgi:hypothetical protein